MNEVDVHIITLGNENKDWLDECVASLENEPVNIHFINGVLGNTSQGRLAGFASGSAPYVSFVDPDDVVIPGAFQKCLDAMTDDCVGAYTDEILIDAEGEHLGKGRSSAAPGWDLKRMLDHPTVVHHLTVGKREYAQRCFEHLIRRHIRCEWVFHFAMAQFGPWIHLDTVGYKWRLHGSNSSKVTAPNNIMAQAKAIAVMLPIYRNMTALGGTN